MNRVGKTVRTTRWKSPETSRNDGPIWLPRRDCLAPAIETGALSGSPDPSIPWTI